MHVGEIIHKVRKDKKMTLVELSEKSGVALATLSRIENGRMTGTLESHVNICGALELALPELYKNFEASTKTVEVQTRAAKTDVSVHNKKFSSEMLASNLSGKKMMPILIRINKNGATSNEETRPGVEKFVYILDGKVEAHVGNEKYDLTKGDTLYFESSVPHHFKNTGTGESHLVILTCPPIL